MVEHKSAALAAATFGMVSAVLVVSGLGASWATVALVGYFVAMSVASYTDLVERRVPNALLKVAIPVELALFSLAGAQEDGYYLGALVGAATLFIMFGIFHLKAPTKFGAGDVKTGFLVGMAVCWFGIAELRSLLIWTLVVLAAVGLPLLLRHGRRAAPPVPFIPILSVASSITIIAAIG